jgi:diguanylate cyclase (GGDEF)-like protein
MGGVVAPHAKASRAAAAGIALVLICVSALALLVSQRLSAEVALAGNAALDEDLFQGMQYCAAQEQLALTTYQMDGSDQARDAYRLQAQIFDESLAGAASLDEGGEGEGDGTDDTQVLLQLKAIHADYRRTAEQMIRLHDTNRRADAVSVAARLSTQGRLLLETLDELEADHKQATVNALQGASASGRLLRLGTPIVLLLTVVLLAGLAMVTRGHQRAVKRQSLHDALTGLPNRVLFADRASQALAAAGRSGDHPVVMMLDLDRFKDVNDTLGHHAGDIMLVEVADRLRTVVRPNDTVARLGGDEFAILLTSGGQAVGTEVATRVLRALEEPFSLEGVSVGVEASIGVATSERILANADADGEHVEDLLRQADAAMYVAKAERSGYSHYSAGQAGDVTTEHLTLLSELREALDHDQLVLHYQPKVSADSGELTGVEALVRWEHPSRGLVGPDQFIPLAEGTTLIHRITRHVVSKALAFSRGWLDQGLRMPVAVNVSARSLLDRGFPARIAHQLEQAGVPADLLSIEITESTIMLDPDRALAVLRELHDMGVQLSVDDFGTGYSSMSYLKVLPVSELKVDRSFVRHMAADQDDAVLVQSAIDLGHNLGLSVVAEGVEDNDTLTALRELGVDLVQGFYLGRPMPEHLLRDWASQREMDSRIIPRPPGTNYSPAP